MMSQTVWAHCRNCNAEWTVGTLPMESRAFGLLLQDRARQPCPNCKATGTVLMGRARPTPIAAET